MIKKSLFIILSLIFFTPFIAKGDDFQYVVNLQKQAELGDAKAMFELGDYYDFKREPKNEEEAFKWYLQSAEKGYPLANQRLGRIYLNGFLATREKQDSVWLVSIHSYPIEGEDLQKAIEYLDKASVSDNCPFSQFSLGKLFYTGEKVERDYAKAVKYLKRAANNPNSAKDDKAQAMNWLSNCYRYGRGVEADQEKSDYWREQAAQNGYKDAMTITGTGCFGTLYFEDGTPFGPTGDSLVTTTIVKRRNLKPGEEAREQVMIFMPMHKGEFELYPEFNGKELVFTFSGDDYEDLEFIGGQDLKLTVKRKHQ